MSIDNSSPPSHEDLIRSSGGLNSGVLIEISPENTLGLCFVMPPPPASPSTPPAPPTPVIPPPSPTPDAFSYTYLRYPRDIAAASLPLPENDGITLEAVVDGPRHVPSPAALYQQELLSDSLAPYGVHLTTLDAFHVEAVRVPSGPPISNIHLPMHTSSPSPSKFFSRGQVNLSTSFHANLMDGRPTRAR
ncbi:hypothetical protein FA95DRAFT_1565196, partial [Auriscalpium vulgare]